MAIVSRGRIQPPASGLTLTAEAGYPSWMTLASRLVARLLDLPPAKTHDLVIDRDLQVRTPDGVVLLADRYAPRGSSRLPTILVRSPYGRRGIFGALFGAPFAERGFQVLVQSCRGTFGSGGHMDPFANERADGLATVAWMKEQPWYSGELATIGLSYLGFVQWAIALEAGEDLKAMVPQVTTSDFRGQTYAGESFTLDTALSWTRMMANQEKTPIEVLWSHVMTKRTLDRVFGELPLSEADVRATGARSSFYQQWLVHNAPGDAYWPSRGFSENVAKVTAPVHLIGGLYDIFLPWQILDYNALRSAGRDPYLTIGPWVHSSPALMRTSAKESLIWLQAHVLGDRRALREAPVRVFVTGADAWRDFSAFPPPAARPQRWYLASGRRLSQGLPAASEPDRYRYDPADPTPAVAGPSLNGRSGVADNRALESRRDVLTFTSDPLERDLDVIGPVRAELHVRSSLEHTDFFARLCDVEPSGKSINVCDALLRVQPGAPAAEADGSLKIAIDLWPTAHRFRRGHSLRLQVSSGAHPRFARNPGTGEPLATAMRLVAADQVVYHDAEHPSAIVLSVLAGPAVG
jgi:putative CocE/NonD family hydrolase